MKLNPIASNMNSLELENGTEILFSYKTPVAAFVPGTGLIKTATKWSSATSRHISKWLAGRDAKEVDQAVIDSLAGN